MVTDVRKSMQFFEKVILCRI